MATGNKESHTDGDAGASQAGAEAEDAFLRWSRCKLEARNRTVVLAWIGTTVLAKFPQNLLIEMLTGTLNAEVDALALISLLSDAVARVIIAIICPDSPRQQLKMCTPVYTVVLLYLYSVAPIHRYYSYNPPLRTLQPFLLC